MFTWNFGHFLCSFLYSENISITIKKLALDFFSNVQLGKLCQKKRKKKREKHVSMNIIVPWMPPCQCFFYNLFVFLQAKNWCQTDLFPWTSRFSKCGFCMDIRLTTSSNLFFHTMDHFYNFIESFLLCIYLIRSICSSLLLLPICWYGHCCYPLVSSINYCLMYFQTYSYKLVDYIYNCCFELTETRCVYPTSLMYSCSTLLSQVSWSSGRMSTCNETF